VLGAAAERGITLRVVTFSQSTHTAEEAARAVGAALGQIVKSLVFVAPEADPPNVVVALVSGVNRANVARLAAITGLPGLRRATAREASEATGFAIGGIPPVGHAKPTRVVMDPDLERHETVWAAAGTPHAVFATSPAELRLLSGAMVAPFAEPAATRP
jgi:prolyl-tRNA editing enzyme YbaK/EbsC (Cys-tRNA(Pro) deacylase)